MSDNSSNEKAGCIIWAVIVITAGIFLYYSEFASMPTQPLPTIAPTPRFSFHNGNEEEAQISFAEYYKLELIDCYFGTIEGAEGLPDTITVLDRDFQVIGEYLGDGRWRFNAQVYTLDLAKDDDVPIYELRQVEIRSLPNNKWENICVGTTDLEDDVYAQVYGNSSRQIPTPTPVKAITTTGSNIRTGPGTNYSVIQVAKKGESLNIVGQNETALWYQLDNGGWISASLVNPAPEEMPIVVTPVPPVVAPKATATVKSTTAPQATKTIAPMATVQVATPTPTQCNIKGNISYNTGEKIYHVPGQKYYEATRISVAYGERWFCSEEEAKAAGWRRSYE